MENKKKNVILKVLNRNVLDPSRSIREQVEMGLGLCEIRCLQAHLSPGNTLSKV